VVESGAKWRINTDIRYKRSYVFIILFAMGYKALSTGHRNICG